MTAAAYRRACLGSALALFSACATVGPATDQPIVDRISIEGAVRIQPRRIKERIVTSEESWIPGSNPAYFDPNTWQADLRRIERYYESQGFYQAEIVHSEVVPHGPGRVVLNVQISEGEPVVVTQLVILGLEELPGELRGTVLDDLPLRLHEPFSEDGWAATKAKLSSRLREVGYAEAQVHGEVHLTVAAKTAEVTLGVKPGKRYRFGDIFVATDPNPHVPPKRIIEQALGAIQPGSWYSESALAEAQGRVFKMGVFGAVKINRGAPDQARGTIPIVVDVREAPMRTVRTGAGAGVDTTRNEFRALFEYSNRNFFGDLRRLTFRTKVGYAFLPDVLRVIENPRDLVTQQGPIFDSQIEFEQPRFLFRDVRFQASIGAERDLEQGYNLLGGKGRFGLIWQPITVLTFFPSYNYEHYWINGQVFPGGRTPDLAFGCPSPCVLSYLEQTVELDRRDDRVGPRRGFYLSLSLQEGGGPLGGSFEYLRLLPDTRAYYTFPGNKLTLAGKLRVGTLIPASGADTASPIISRFYSGGGSSMRGFGNRRLSPLLVVPVPTSTGYTGQTIPIGGNGLWESSLEARYALTADLVVAAFIDAGFVTVERFVFNDPTYVTSHLYYDVGLGLRYRTLVGPIRIDLARRLNFGPPLPIVQPGGANLTYPPAPACFFGRAPTNYAGAPEDPCAFQLSIGEAF